uniref:Protein kinase domain-containing protein n=1 Tax=Entomoneis paludosa TaxID=265537 RepID=A0A7S2Y836_9STRA
MFRKIVAGKYDFNKEDWEGVSDDARDLVKRLLVLDPDGRMTAKQAVRHRWLKASRDSLSLINLQNTSQRLKTFNARMKLRSAVIAIDWVASLKRMSWFSSRNLSDDASVGSAASHGSARLLAVAALSKRREGDDDEEDGFKLGASNHGKNSSGKSHREKLSKSKKSSKSKKKTDI